MLLREGNDLISLRDFAAGIACLVVQPWRHPLVPTFQDEYPVAAVTRVARRIALANPVR